MASIATIGESGLARDSVIVIGAGIGGLVTAGLLAAEGADVLLCEAGDVPGGKARADKVGDALVDAGPTVFTMKPVFDAIFDALGSRIEDHAACRPATILARHAWDPARSLDLHADRSASIDAVGDFAGADAARGYRAFATEAQRIHDILEPAFMHDSKCTPPELMWRIGLHRIADQIALRPYESLWTVLGEHFRDPRLRQLFARYATYCGASPFRAPATLMLVAHVEAKGVWLIDGGIAALAHALATLAERHGARIRYGAKVARILTRHGRASGVELASGERIEADSIVLNADPAALGSGAFGAGAAKALAPMPPLQRSLSAFTFLGTGRLTGRPLARHNVFFSGDYPAEFAALRAWRMADAPTAYLCAIDRDDAGNEPSGDERFQIIVNAPPIGDVHRFTDEEIAACTTAMLERLRLCGLELQPSALRVTTPTDFARRFPSTGGALYGRASHGWAGSFLRPGARTRIPGLYCAGGSTHPGAGVPMAALSAQVAVRTWLKDRASIARSRPAAMPGGISTPSATIAATA